MCLHPNDSKWKLKMLKRRKNILGSSTYVTDYYKEPKDYIYSSEFYRHSMISGYQRSPTIMLWNSLRPR